MTKEKTTQQEFELSGDKIVETVKNLIKEGNIRQITIKNEAGVTLLVIPLSLVLIGSVLAPVLAAVGAVAALLTKCTVVVERRS